MNLNYAIRAIEIPEVPSPVKFTEYPDPCPHPDYWESVYDKDGKEIGAIGFSTTPAHVRARATHTGSSSTPDGDSTHKAG